MDEDTGVKVGQTQGRLYTVLHQPGHSNGGMMRYVRTYFAKGAVVDRKNIRIPFAIKDPPVTGNSYAFILGEGEWITLFHPTTLLAYVIPDTAEEIALAEDVPFDLQHMIDFINRKYGEYKSLEMNRNYKIAKAVLFKLDAQLPKEMVEEFEVPDEEDYLL